MRKQRGFVDGMAIIVAGTLWIGAAIGVSSVTPRDTCHDKPNVTEKAKNGNYSYTVTACEVERRTR